MEMPSSASIPKFKKLQLVMWKWWVANVAKRYDEIVLKIEKKKKKDAY